MSVQYSRRKICRLAAGIPVALPFFTLPAAATSDVSRTVIRVNAEYAEPHLVKDSLVVVDTGVTRFDGNGIYIYPDWGNPLVYEVIRNKQGKIEFYYPGKKTRLWVMNQDNPDAVFSGKAAGFLLPGEDQAAGLSEYLVELQVPSQPLT